MHIGTVIVTRQGFESVLVPVYIELYILKISCHLLNLGTINQCLPLEHKAEQQTDNHQYNSKLNKREAFIFIHFTSFLLFFLKTIFYFLTTDVTTIHTLPIDHPPN